MFVPHNLLHLCWQFIRQKLMPEFGKIVFKSTCFSSRRPKFGSLHEAPAEACNSDSTMGFSGLFGHLRKYGMHSHRHTYLLINKYFFHLSKLGLSPGSLASDTQSLLFHLPPHGSQANVHTHTMYFSSAERAVILAS